MTEAQESSLGDVLDLSRIGARVSGPGKPPLKIGETMTLGLVAPEGTLRVPARVVWIRKPRFRHWEMGLEFVDVELRKQVAVERLAKYGCVSIPDGVHEEPAAPIPPPPKQEPTSTPTPDSTPKRAERRGTSSSSSTASSIPDDGRQTTNRKPRTEGLKATYVERDHYRLLQVQPDADEETIRLAFRTLAKRLHPDRNPSPDARRRFEVIKQAYDVLRDAKRRAAYDTARRGEASGNRAA